MAKEYTRKKSGYIFLLVGGSLLALTWTVLIEQSLPLYLAIVLAIGSMGSFIVFVVFFARLKPSFSLVCPDCGYRNINTAELCARCGRQLE